MKSTTVAHMKMSASDAYWFLGFYYNISKFRRMQKSVVLIELILLCRHFLPKLNVLCLTFCYIRVHSRFRDEQLFEFAFLVYMH